MRYRRADAKGGTYFFTVNHAERQLRLLVDHVAVLRAAVKEVKRRHPFHIDAFVVLPDHLHAIWTLPEGDADFAMRWMLIKAGFSRHIAKGERRNASRIGKGERGIWQRRYWECNPPIFSASQKRSYAAIISFCMGVMPPSAMFGRS